MKLPNTMIVNGIVVELKDPSECQTTELGKKIFTKKEHVVKSIQCFKSEHFGICKGKILAKIKIFYHVFCLCGSHFNDLILYNLSTYGTVLS